MLYKKNCQVCVNNVKEYFVAQWFVLLPTYILVFDDKFQPVKIPVHFVLNF